MLRPVDQASAEEARVRVTIEEENIVEEFGVGESDEFEVEVVVRAAERSWLLVVLNACIRPAFMSRSRRYPSTTNSFSHR
jgi:hypothetical protein